MSKKAIPIKNIGLYGAESEQEIHQEEVEQVERVEKKKVRGKNRNVMSIVNSALNFFKIFLEEQKLGEKNSEEIVSCWNDQENMERFSNFIKTSFSQLKPLKPRKRKDVNAPKRNKCAYVFFSTEKREELQKKNSNMSPEEISMKVANAWKSLSTSKKVRFEKLAKDDKDRYVDEIKNYNSPNAPKRNLSSYMFFCADKRAEIKDMYPNFKTPEISKELGRLWKEDYADDQSRKIWVDLAIEDKERYVLAMKEWQELHPELRKESVSKKKKVESVQKSEQGSLTSSFPKADFSKIERPKILDEFPDWTPQQIAQEIKRRWSKKEAD